MFFDSNDKLEAYPTLTQQTAGAFRLMDLGKFLLAARQSSMQVIVRKSLFKYASPASRQRGKSAVVGFV